MKLHNPSLLITDDDRDFRETLAGVFRSRGFHTIQAADGEEAVEIVRHERVHLVLLDMHMPRLTGLETIQRIHELKLSATLPFILISAALDDAIAAEARRQNAFSILSKPFRLRDITGLVNRAFAETYGCDAE